jgi:hypothetical protein
MKRVPEGMFVTSGRTKNLNLVCSTLLARSCENIDLVIQLLEGSSSVHSPENGDILYRPAVFFLGKTPGTRQSSTNGSQM